MNSAYLIRQYIESLPEGKTFGNATLRMYASSDNIRQIMSRLTKIGLVKRIGRGLFVKAGDKNYKEQKIPSSLELADLVSKQTGEVIAIHGAEASRLLKLSTQMPMKPIFYTNGNSRTLNIGNRVVKLVHVNPSKLIAAGTKEGLVISALQYLGKTNVTLETLEEIKNNPDIVFTRVIKYIEEMPSWLADLFFKLEKERN